MLPHSPCIKYTLTMQQDMLNLIDKDSRWKNRICLPPCPHPQLQPVPCKFYFKGIVLRWIFLHDFTGNPSFKAIVSFLVAYGAFFLQDQGWRQSWFGQVAWCCVASETVIKTERVWFDDLPSNIYSCRGKLRRVSQIVTSAIQVHLTNSSKVQS